MGTKYFVWSFDDGLEQDKKIVEILRSFNMGATFNLNSDLFGTHKMIGRIGTLGIKEVPVDEFTAKKHHLLKYVSHYRIPENEIRQVYDGFEIAAHTTGHQNLAKHTGKDLYDCIQRDVRRLNEISGQEVCGFAYPFGAVNDDAKPILKECGIRYARTVKTSGDFTFPSDPLETNISCWHISNNTFKKLDMFLSAPEKEEDMLFIMFAHGYEFDFDIKESSWDKFKRICDQVTSHNDVVCCSAREALLAHQNHK